MLNVFVAEFPTVLAYCKPHAVPTRPVIGAEIFGVEGLDRIATFYADGHCMQMVCVLSSVVGGLDHGWDMSPSLYTAFGGRVFVTFGLCGWSSVH